MLNDIGPPLLIFMLAVFVFSVVFGLICLLLLLSQGQRGDALKTLLYLLLLAAFTAVVVYPTLRMHGSFSSIERLLLLLLHLANLMLMTVFIRSRLRLIADIHKRHVQLDSDKANDL